MGLYCEEVEMYAFDDEGCVGEEEEEDGEEGVWYWYLYCTGDDPEPPIS